MLAPVTNNNLEELKKEVEGMKFNDNESSDEEGEKLEEI